MSQTLARPSIITEWAIRVQSKEHELKGSYTVMFFLGEVPKQPRDWISAPSFVGTHDVYTYSLPPPPEEEDKVVQSIVDLTIALKARLPDSPLTPGIVTRYLTNQLRWRIQRAMGSDEGIPNSNLPSLQPTVFSYQLKFNPELRIYLPHGDPVDYPECTAGRDGM